MTDMGDGDSEAGDVLNSLSKFTLFETKRCVAPCTKGFTRTRA